MTRKRTAARRSGWVLIVSAAAWAQSAPLTRFVIVDGGRAPVRSAARLSPEVSLDARIADIYRNESAAVDTCLNYVDAQWTYYRSVPHGDGRPAFAEKIRGAAGLRDGLYWPIGADGEESPMGPRFAAAAAAELNQADVQPLFGYYFKILVAQGREAAGGAANYHVDGRLVNGFALIAWPARYGVTGVRVFQVNHRGDVYAKDLGADTSRIAGAVVAFAPDRTWIRVASIQD